MNEGREGTTNLNTLYKQLNKQYFGSALPTIPCSWSGRMTNAVGRAHVSYLQRGRAKSRSMSLFIAKYSETLPAEDVDIDMKSLNIKLSKKFDLSANDITAVMLHEMCHIKLYIEKKINGHHGSAEFDGMITKLKSESGLDIPYKESKFKKSPKIKAKEGFLILLRQSDGKYGVATFGIPWMKKNYAEFATTMTRIMNLQGGGRIQSIVYYKIKHRVIADYPARRSLKRISWTMIDDELAEEIKRKGKFWGESYIGGGKYSPHLAGLTTGKMDIELDKRGRLPERV